MISPHWLPECCEVWLTLLRTACDILWWISSYPFFLVWSSESLATRWYRMVVGSAFYGERDFFVFYGDGILGSCLYICWWDFYSSARGRRVAVNSQVFCQKIAVLLNMCIVVYECCIWDTGVTLLLYHPVGSQASILCVVEEFIFPLAVKTRSSEFPSFVSENS